MHFVVSKSVGDVGGALAIGDKLDEPADFLFDSREAGAVVIKIALHGAAGLAQQDGDFLAKVVHGSGNEQLFVDRGVDAFSYNIFAN